MEDSSPVGASHIPQQPRKHSVSNIPAIAARVEAVTHLHAMEVVIHERRLISSCNQLQNPDGCICDDLIPLLHRIEKWDPFCSEASDEAVCQEHPCEAGLMQKEVSVCCHLGYGPFVMAKLTTARQSLRASQLAIRRSTWSVSVSSLCRPTMLVSMAVHMGRYQGVWRHAPYTVKENWTRFNTAITM